MCMTMHYGISICNWRQIIFIELMTVSCENILAVNVKYGIFCHNREFQYHLVYF